MIIPIALLYLVCEAQLPNDDLYDGDFLDKVCIACAIGHILINMFVIIAKGDFWNSVILGYASIVAILICQARNNQLGQTLNFGFTLFCIFTGILNY